MKYLIILIAITSLLGCGGGKDSNGKTGSANDDAIDKLVTFLDDTSGDYDTRTFWQNGGSNNGVSIGTLEMGSSPSSSQLVEIRNTATKLTNDVACGNYDGGVECNYVGDIYLRETYLKGSWHREEITIKHPKGHFYFEYNSLISFDTYSYILSANSRKDTSIYNIGTTFGDEIKGDWGFSLVNFIGDSAVIRTGNINCTQSECTGDLLLSSVLPTDIEYPFSRIGAAYLDGPESAGQLMELITSKDNRTLGGVICPTFISSPNYNLKNCSFLLATRI